MKPLVDCLLSMLLQCFYFSIHKIEELEKHFLKCCRNSHRNPFYTKFDIRYNSQFRGKSSKIESNDNRISVQSKNVSVIRSFTFFEKSHAWHFSISNRQRVL